MQRRERRSHTSPAGTFQPASGSVVGGEADEDTQSWPLSKHESEDPEKANEEDEQSRRSSPTSSTPPPPIPPAAVSELAAQLRADVAQKLGLMSEDLQAVINSRVDHLFSIMSHHAGKKEGMEWQQQLTPGSVCSGRSKPKSPPRSLSVGSSKTGDKGPGKSLSGVSYLSDSAKGLKSLTVPHRGKKPSNENAMPGSFKLSPLERKSRSPQGTVLGARKDSTGSSCDHHGYGYELQTSDTFEKVDKGIKAGKKEGRRSLRSLSSMDDQRSDQRKYKDELTSTASDVTSHSHFFSVIEKDKGCPTDLRSLQDRLNIALLADHSIGNLLESEDGSSYSDRMSRSGDKYSSGDAPPFRYTGDAPPFDSINPRVSQSTESSFATRLSRKSFESNQSQRPVLSVIQSMRSVISSNPRSASLQAMINIRSQDLVSNFLTNLEGGIFNGEMCLAVIKLSIVLAFWVAGVALTTIQVISTWPTQDSKLSLIYDTTFALGSSLSLGVLFVTGRLHVFSHGGMYSILVASDKNIALKWRKGRCRWMAEMCLWMPAFAMSRAAVYLAHDHNKLSASGLISLSIISGVYMGQAFYIIHIIKAMEVMIDAFCFKMVVDPSCRRSICDWNTLQAMLRSVSNAIAPCFVSLFTTVLVLLLLVVNQIVVVESSSTEDILAVAAPTLLLMLIFFRLLCQACEVSGKCSRVPPFVNSLCFGDRADQIDKDRQYLVTYISNSAAGFYIFDIHLTQSVTFKAFYLLGAIIFFVITKFTSLRPE
mmetsp:Transcript_62246/g.111229  ORF Transcript_62246/g.111229 Transcript_62246/m.111229 type:complete len:763 (-) Transcript_62246:135-2423(-)